MSYNNSTYIGSALNTDNEATKKQVFELLSALCVYSKDGTTFALETLAHLQVGCL
jgi:hypothetical protein